MNSKNRFGKVSIVDTKLLSVTAVIGNKNICWGKTSHYFSMIYTGMWITGTIILTGDCLLDPFIDSNIFSSKIHHKAEQIFFGHKDCQSSG